MRIGTANAMRLQTVMSLVHENQTTFVANVLTKSGITKRQIDYQAS